MRTRISLCVVAMLCLSCDNSTGPEPYRCPNAYSGITGTDAAGAMTGAVDTNDWQSTTELDSLVAYPNPAAASCTIRYHLVDSLRARIRVQDRSSHTVRHLVDATVVGVHQVTWNFTDDDGNALPDCIYRVVFEVDAPGGVERSYGDVQRQR